MCDGQRQTRPQLADGPRFLVIYARTKSISGGFDHRWTKQSPTKQYS